MACTGQIHISKMQTFLITDQSDKAKFALFYATFDFLFAGRVYTTVSTRSFRAF